MWINGGDIILIGLRDYQDGKADVILKYSSDEARNLKAYGELPESGETPFVVFCLLHSIMSATLLGMADSRGIVEVLLRSSDLHCGCQIVTFCDYVIIGADDIVRRHQYCDHFVMLVCMNVGGCLDVWACTVLP